MNFISVKRETRTGFLENSLTFFPYREIHHLYYGYGIILVGCAVGGLVGVVLIALGIWVAVDDVYQHFVQVRTPEYVSPLGRMFFPLYRTAFWRALVKRFSFLKSVKRH